MHTGFLSPYRVLRQSDLIDMSTWNYLKAQRLQETLLLNCAGISSLPLAQLLLDMRAKFNLLKEPWWPVLAGISKETHDEIIDLLQTRFKLYGAHLYAWDSQEAISHKKDATLICANRGETLYEIDADTNYVVQLDADQRQCCLGYATDENEKFYRNVVKLESRTR